MQTNLNCKLTTEQKDIRCPLSPFMRKLKLISDVTLAFVGTLVFSPLILVIAIALKIEGRGPLIFKQERIGKGGKPFMLYKFRTMVTNAEASGPQLCKTEDRRLTPMGSFLRRHHLDEFPQLWNVIKGDMSFVGPRPERKFFIDQIMELNPNYALLYEIRPGLFSPATLYNGYTDTMEKMLSRLDMDLEYMQHQSFLLDMEIILKTAVAILTGKKF